MQVEIVEATIDHAYDLGPRLRERDKAEVMASCGATPIQALAESVNLSRYAWTAMLDGSPEIMWGVADHVAVPGVGVVWLLSSYEMYRIKGRFVVESEVFVAKMLRHYDTLFNYVHDKNTASRRWLESLGFRPLKSIPDFGAGREPFTLFARNRHV